MDTPSIKGSGVKEKVLAALFLILLLVIYYHSVVIKGNSFMTALERNQVGQYFDPGTYWHDAGKHFSADPVAADQINLLTAYLENFYLKNLQLPLWNPYSGLGRPYNADMNSYTFFLPIYLFKLFPSLMMYDIFLLLRLFISGFFLFLILRLFRCFFWVAIAGASVYMLNSHFFAFIDMDHLNVTMWLAPMVYFLSKFHLSSNKRYLIGFIFCSAGSFFGGNPNEFILIHLCVSFFFIFNVFIKKEIDATKKFYFFLSYVGALGLSFLLSSVKWIPFMEFWKNSVSRGNAGLAGFDTFLSFREFLVWILSPDRIFGGPNYIGYLCLSLVFYAALNLFRKRWRMQEKVVAFHFVLLVFIISKISNAAYIKWVGTLPILRDINFVKYCSLLYYAAAVILSFSLMYMVAEMKENKNKIIRLCLFLLCCIAPHLIFRIISRESLFQSAENRKTLLYVFIAFIFVGLFLILMKRTRTSKYIINGAVIVLLLLVVLELRLNNHQYYRKRFEIKDKAPYTRFLMEQTQPYRALGILDTLSPNSNLIYPIPTINRLFAMRVKRATLLLSRLISQKFNRGMPQTYLKEEMLNNPYLDILNTRYYIMESVMDSMVIDQDYVRSFKIDSLRNNPSMRHTQSGNYSYYIHSGWQQLADSSVDIPVHLPYGDVNLRSTSVAFNFDWRKREDPNNSLSLTISVKKGSEVEVVFHKSFIAHRGEDQDFFPLEADLSKFAGQDVVINFTLKNPGAKSKEDRSFFFGDLRITYNKVKKFLPEDSTNENLTDSTYLESLPYEEVFFHHALVYKNNRASDRGFMLYDVKQVRDLHEALEIMRKEPHSYKETAIIEGSYRQEGKIDQKGSSRISFLENRPNYVKIDVETSENGVFILSDAYYPGWKARLDKKRVKIYPAFCAIRGVFIPKGKYELEFIYRPWTFYLGALLTCISMVFLGFLFIHHWPRFKKK
ncbi:YfhO family protein [Acidobacteriota bacterium]